MRRSPWVRAGALVLVVSTLLATALAFASGLGGSDDPSLVGLTPATSTTLDAPQRALAALLPDGPLDGMVRSDDDLGPLDLRAAADAYPFGDPDGKGLETFGFVRGFSRSWAGADGRSAHVVVYEMRDPSGFLADWRTAVESFADSHFPTPVGDGISDVEGDEGTADRSEAAIVSWVEGPHWYYVVHFGGADGTGPTHVGTIVAAVQAP